MYHGNGEKSEWGKFEGNRFFDPKCSGPLLERLPLNFHFGVNSLFHHKIFHCLIHFLFSQNP